MKHKFKILLDLTINTEGERVTKKGKKALSLKMQKQVAEEVARLLTADFKPGELDAVTTLQEYAYEA